MSIPFKTDVLIFTPTSEEREFTQKYLCEPELNCVITYNNKELIYDKAKIKTTNKTFEVILISPEKAGPFEAYDYLKKQLKIWDPYFLIVLGVAGGYKFRNVKIGDIILPRQITEFALVKDKPDGQEPRPDHFRVTEEIVIAAKRFFDSNREKIQNKCDFENISCFSDGTILSSVALQAKTSTQEEAISKLIEADGKIYGIEQESSGIARLMEEHKSIKWMIIRAVMDLADDLTRSSPEKDQIKRKATELAAYFCLQFLKWYLVKIDRINENKIQNMVNYLNKIGTLEIHCTSYDEDNYLQTKKYSVNGEIKIFNMEGKCSYQNSEIRLFIDINNKTDQIELEEEFEVFLKDCFSIWVNENKDSEWMARFIFVSDHPFFCSDKFEIKNSIDFLQQVLIELDKDLVKYIEEFGSRIEQNFLSLLNIIFHTQDDLLLLK